MFIFRMLTAYLMVVTLIGISSPNTNSFHSKEIYNVHRDQNQIGQTFNLINYLDHFGRKGDKRKRIGDNIGTNIGDGASNTCSGNAASCNYGTSHTLNNGKGVVHGLHQGKQKKLNSVKLIGDKI